MMRFNLFHRPAKGDQYAIFRRQQAEAHQRGLVTTVFLHYRDLFDEQTLADARADAAGGDELGLALHALDGPELDGVIGNLQAIWLFSAERKQVILERILAKWRAVLGSDPVSVASYHLDSSTLRILRELAPGVRNVVGGCFEEGVRVFHGCNHSWYLFNEGMPWNPWYPAADHSLRPAQDETDAAGVLAVPHLLRDMSLSYEGRNDFWASHPANVIRGMGNEASFNPYDRNLIDQFRLQEDFNAGYSYYNSFVSTAWLTWNHNSEYPPEVAWSLYLGMLDYLAELKQAGAAGDLTLAQYGDWHRAHRPIALPECYLAKEMLYGSGKHYFWYVDTRLRILVDATQGASIGDLRPYAGKVSVATGSDTEHRENGSYPYLIQSQHRTGFAHHYEDGSRSSLLIRHKRETIDLAACPCKVEAIDRDAAVTTVRFSPATFRFKDGLTGTIITELGFPHNSGRINIRRTLAHLSEPKAKVNLTEYLKAAPGRTEYPVDLHGISLSVNGIKPACIAFDYSGISHGSANATCLCADIPQTNTRLDWMTESPTHSGRIRPGHLFSPYFELALEFKPINSGEISSWLTLSPINP
jgi:hypothetical protein